MKALSGRVRNLLRCLPMLKDAKDEIDLATAVNRQADALTTSDLTELANPSGISIFMTRASLGCKHHGAI